MRAVIQCSASITVLPVTMVAGSMLSRRRASAAVPVGAQCSAAIGPMIAVDLFGPGWRILPLEACLDVRDRNLAVIGGERHRRGGAFWTTTQSGCSSSITRQARQQRSGQRVERLVGASGRGRGRG
jgi:hypothetical protein